MSTNPTTPTPSSTTDSTGYSSVTPDGALKRANGADFAYLPAPTVQSHAANLLTLPDGRLGCVWFGGRGRSCRRRSEVRP